MGFILLFNCRCIWVFFGTSITSMWYYRTSILCYFYFTIVFLWWYIIGIWQQNYLFIWYMYVYIYTNPSSILSVIGVHTISVIIVISSLVIFLIKYMDIDGFLCGTLIRFSSNMELLLGISRMKFRKCESWLNVAFFGHVISKDGI